MGMLYTPASVTRIVSAALIAGTITGNVIAAPGAGLTLRLRAFHISFSSAVAAATLANGFLDFAGTQVASFGLGNNRSDSAFIIPEPGVPGPANTALTYSITASAAGGTCFIIAYYDTF